MIKYISAQKDLNCDIKLPIFACESYLVCKSRCFGWFESNNFVIPFVIQKKIAFKWLTFTYKPLPKQPVLSKLEQKEFLQDIITFLKKNKICDFVNKAQSYVVFDIVPDSCDFIEYGTYKLEINKTNNEIIMGCSKTHRNKIRKAMRNGVSVKETDDVTLVYDLIKNTLKRSNSVFYPPIEYLTNLKRVIPNNVRFFIAEKLNIVQGVSVVVFDDFSGYYMYGGSKPSPISGANNLLHFEILKFLRDQGIYTYDFVGARINVQKGSKHEGIQRFKSGFGPKIQKGYTFRVVIKPFKYSLFRLSAKLYGFITGNKYNDVIDQVKNEVDNK